MAKRKLCQKNSRKCQDVGHRGCQRMLHKRMVSCKMIRCPLEVGGQLGGIFPGHKEIRGRDMGKGQQPTYWGNC